MPKRILIVDDEPVILSLLTEIMTEDGFSVVTASNGREALERLRNVPDITVMFTDLMMPVMDGITLIKEARLLRPALIPIIMTGYATLETARAAVKEGAFDYVLKPFSLAEIRMAVKNALERQELTTENARLREVTELFIISEQIASMRDERLLLEFVLKAALDRVDARRGSLMLVSEDGRSLEIAASVGVPEEATRGMVSTSKSISGRVAQSRTPLLINDIRTSSEVKDMGRGLSDTSFVSVPLERKLAGRTDGRRGNGNGNGQRVLAVLNVNDKRSGGTFSESDLKTLSIVANHASAALENVRLIRDIENAHFATLESMARLLEAKDSYTRGHSDRVQQLAMLAAREMGMSKDDIQTVRIGAALHDLGKVGVSDAILNKVERLDNDEWDVIKNHPVTGFDVLQPVAFMNKEHLQLIRNHHERLDGSGYPDGLEQSELPELVRILSVADAYDAMSSSRAYRQGMSPDRIIAELRRCSGAQFDARVADLFIRLIEQGQLQPDGQPEPNAMAVD
jgi:response regulator RpfG family c-di-GMP phosphodiesterase